MIKSIKKFYMERKSINLVDNQEDNKFLTDVSITGNISQQVT